MNRILPAIVASLGLSVLSAAVRADDFPEPGVYQATPNDYERVRNLGDFFGSWTGTLLPVHDPKGVWRDNTEGFEIEIELGEDVAQVRMKVNSEWATITTQDARASFVDSALVISEVYVSTQSHALSLILQRSSSDNAKAWLLYTGGNPYLPDEHVWSSYGALAVGEVHRKR